MNNVSFNPSFKDIANYLFPIGSLYYTQDSSFNPNAHFGGSWVQIKDKFILACGDTYKINQTGGEATHTLTIDEAPQHTHSVYSYYGHTAPYEPKTSWGYNSTSDNSGKCCVSQNYTDSCGLTLEGGNKPHNNMPPYETAYIWKRNA